MAFNVKGPYKESGESGLSVTMDNTAHYSNAIERLMQYPLLPSDRSQPRQYAIQACVPPGLKITLD